MPHHDQPAGPGIQFVVWGDRRWIELIPHRAPIVPALTPAEGTHVLLHQRLRSVPDDPLAAVQQFRDQAMYTARRLVAAWQRSPGRTTFVPFELPAPESFTGRATIRVSLAALMPSTDAASDTFPATCAGCGITGSAPTAVRLHADGWRATATCPHGGEVDPASERWYCGACYARIVRRDFGFVDGATHQPTTAALAYANWRRRQPALEYAIDSAAFLRDDIAARRGDVAAASRLVGYNIDWTPRGRAHQALRANANGRNLADTERAELLSCLYLAFRARHAVQPLRVTPHTASPSAMPLPVYRRWLVEDTRRRAVDSLEADARVRGTRKYAADLRAALAPEPPTPLHLLMDRDHQRSSRALMSALERSLKAEERRCLKFLRDDVSQADMAQRLGTSVRTVKRRLAAIRTKAHLIRLGNRQK